MRDESKIIARTRPLTDPTTFGGRLHLARRQRRISINDLAVATGLGVLTIHGLESGAVITTAPNLERLAIVLQIDRDWLVKGRIAA